MIYGSIVRVFVFHQKKSRFLRFNSLPASLTRKATITKEGAWKTAKKKPEFSKVRQTLASPKQDSSDNRASHTTTNSWIPSRAIWQQSNQMRFWNCYCRVTFAIQVDIDRRGMVKNLCSIVCQLFIDGFKFKSASS